MSEPARLICLICYEEKGDETTYTYPEFVQHEYRVHNVEHL